MKRDERLRALRHVERLRVAADEIVSLEDQVVKLREFLARAPEIEGITRAAIESEIEKATQLAQRLKAAIAGEPKVEST